MMAATCRWHALSSGRCPAMKSAPSELRRTQCQARARLSLHADIQDNSAPAESNGGASSGSSGSDEWYQQWDSAAVHAYEARRVFIECIMRGEPEADIVKAALAISAEDDAIMSHSTVAFPINAFRRRIERLAAECRSQTLAQLPPDAPPAAVAEAVTDFLHRRGFSAPDSGRSALPPDSVVDHPGVWEDPRAGYLHEALITRRGTPAVLCVLLYGVFRQLFLDGATDFMVRMDCRGFEAFPRADSLPLPRAMLALPGSAGGVLNTCTADALYEALSHLKRGFWPYAWDTGLDYQQGMVLGSFGGFPGASREAINGPASTYIQAVSKAAAHRLRRGIWTSPGAGDIRRAIAAAERLVLLTHSCRTVAASDGAGSVAADSMHEALERRDLGVLYVHAGLLEEAKVELQESVRLAPERSVEEDALMQQLLQLVSDVDPAPAQAPLTVDAWLKREKPNPEELEKFPLSW